MMEYSHEEIIDILTNNPDDLFGYELVELAETLDVISGNHIPYCEILPNGWYLVGCEACGWHDVQEDKAKAKMILENLRKQSCF